MTDRKTFEIRNIIEFRDGKYVAIQPVSQEKIKEMKSKMTEEDAAEFEKYLYTYFHI